MNTTNQSPQKHPFKYNVGQRLSRFGQKVVVLDRDVSPNGNNVYQIQEVYKGIVETLISAREDELSQTL